MVLSERRAAVYTPADGNVDKGKGRVKEAAGALTDDQSLKNEGKVDKASGSAKKGIDKVRDAVTGKDK